MAAGPTVLDDRKSDRRGTALCLSGGGFRSALFHLGAIRRLNEIGLLPQIDTISSVSGGSILSAFLAQRQHDLSLPRLEFSDFESQVAAPFRAFTGRDLRTWPILLHLPWNWALPSLRIGHLARRYRRRLTSMPLGELPETPRYVLCATDMVFGVNWEFGRERSGDYQMGYTCDTSTWPLARAVAASSSFPPVFGPMPVGIAAESFAGGRAPADTRRALASRLALTDGGVYDNMGLEPVWKDHALVLVSNGGAPFQYSFGRQPLSRVLRYTGIVTNQTIALRQRLFFTGTSNGSFRGTYWDIGRSADGQGYSNATVEHLIERIRTDLDRFTTAEAKILENHGYWLAAERLASKLPDIGKPRTAVWPHPAFQDEALVATSLRDSHKRFSLRRILGMG